MTPRTPRPVTRPTRALWATLAALGVYLLALGGFTALGFYHDRESDEARCRGVIRVVEIVGEETGADPELIDRVIDRFRADTDC